MPDPASLLQTNFQLGGTTVHILQGDILTPGVSVEGLVSSEDNHMTMAFGVSAALAQVAGPEYASAAQAQCPVKAETVLRTEPFGLIAALPTLKYVLHAAVIDYDSEETPLEQIVAQTTTNALETAEALGLRSVLLPALAAGAGGMELEDCALQMCSAIKAYLVHDRPLTDIYLLLHKPDPTSDGQVDQDDYDERNARFILGANLVLGVPFDPSLPGRQTHDIYGNQPAMTRLVEIISGAVPGKRHAVVLSGPRMGKTTLLDQLFYHTSDGADATIQGYHLARVVFGRLQERTPVSFIFRKILLSLRDDTDDPALIDEIRHYYADPTLDCDKFTRFLDTHPEHYRQVLLLIDDLPRLLQLKDSSLWEQIDCLTQRVQLAFTATDGDQYTALLAQLSESLRNGLEEIRLACIPEDACQTWINDLYGRYLKREPTEAEKEFILQEAGQHPYLISLTVHALIDAIQREVLTAPASSPSEYVDSTVEPYCQAARKAINEARQIFFEQLLGPTIDAANRSELRSLAQAAYNEARKVELSDAIQKGDSDRITELLALDSADDPRLQLHEERLRRLQTLGYVVGADPATVQLMAPSFSNWLMEYFGLRRAPGAEAGTIITQVQITLLRPEPQVIWTLFRGRSAHTTLAQRTVEPILRLKGMEYFSDLLTYLQRKNLNLPAEPPSLLGNFSRPQSLEDIATFIMTHFTSSDIKSYLQSALPGSTVTLQVDDALKDIPWELMLELGYPQDIPFAVGRLVAGQNQAVNRKPVVRGGHTLKALLIGNPVGDLEAAEEEVNLVAEMLRHNPHFDPPDVLIGPQQCQLMAVDRLLSSGQYALVHYAGHSRQANAKSGWRLADALLTTDMLLDILQMKGAPTLVVSSSCQSAKESEPAPLRYENQAFDLPTAFLQTGVEAYIGALWDVEETSASRFSENFYSHLLQGEETLGECVRQAKLACKAVGDPLTWPAFILYGDPLSTPADLFPAFADGANS